MQTKMTQVATLLPEEEPNMFENDATRPSVLLWRPEVPGLLSGYVRRSAWLYRSQLPSKPPALAVIGSTRC
jgi:hypothetical protein